jgi:hypothetical protein
MSGTLTEAEIAPAVMATSKLEVLSTEAVVETQFQRLHLGFLGRLEE